MDSGHSFNLDKMEAQNQSYGEHLPRFVDLLSDLTKNIVHETNDCSINFMTHLMSIEERLQDERKKSETAIDHLGGLETAIQEHQEDRKALESDLQRAVDVNKFVREEIEAARQSMRAIATSIEAMRRELREVENFSREIKMIAINASIASARAGKAGREFTVISSEVRRLASETESVTQRLAPLVQNALKEINAHASTMESDGADDREDILESLSDQEATLDTARANLSEMTVSYSDLLELTVQQQAENKTTQSEIEGSIRSAMSCAQSGDVIRQQAETIDEMLQEMSNFIKDTDLNADICAGVDDLIGKLSQKYVMYSQRRVHMESGHAGDSQWKESDEDLTFELF